MDTLSEVEVIGYVGGAPEVKTLENGTPVVSFSLASNRRVKGEAVAQWHRIECYGEYLTGLIGNNVATGRQLRVRGELIIERKPHRDHADVKMTYVTVVLRDGSALRFLDNKPQPMAESVPNGTVPRRNGKAHAQSTPLDDDSPAEDDDDAL